MPKKPAPNGYYFFMLDFKRREEKFGRRFPGGMPEVSAAASNDWRALPQKEKERYNAIAKERKNDPRPNIPKPDEKRFNSQGVSFAELKREKERQERRLLQESNFTSQFVGDMTLGRYSTCYRNPCWNKILILLSFQMICIIN